MMERKILEVLCVQESKWRGDRARMMVGGRKVLHTGGDGRSNGVGIVISEEISKEVVRVERWNGRIIMTMIRKQLVCVMSVYGPQTGRTEAEKQEFRDALEMMRGMVELETLLCIAGYCNAHIGETEPGEEENVGKPIAFHLSNGTNQQEDKHNRCPEGDDVCRRSCDRCRASGRITRRTGGVE